MPRMKCLLLAMILLLVGCQTTANTTSSPAVKAPPPAQQAAEVEGGAKQPQYEIDYRYVMPENKHEQKCVKQCDEHFEACQADENNRLCEQEYHSCFRLCGGRVEQVTRCVKNCEGED